MATKGLLSTSDGLQASNEEYLPEKPQEPLATDCCETGCSPCVMDLYQQELDRWLQLKAMSIEERRQWWLAKGQIAVATSNSVALSPESFKRFQLVSVVKVTKDSFLYSFQLPENEILGLRVGQHAIMRLRDSNDQTITRQYTPISPIEQREKFDVIIKIYDDGKMSQVIRLLEIGAEVEWRGPFGEFDYRPNRFQELVMLACGTGIAPMIQVIRAVLSNEDDETRLMLLYASRTQHDILLKTFIDEFCDYWNFKAVYFLSQSDEESLAKDKGQICYGNRVKFGRIDRLVLETELTLKSGAQVLICGTKSFEKDMTKYSLQIGFSQQQIFRF